MHTLLFHPCAIHPLSPQVAEWLLEQALVHQRRTLHAGTPGDNITVMVVQLKPLPPLPRASASRLNLRSAGSGELVSPKLADVRVGGGGGRGGERERHSRGASRRGMPDRQWRFAWGALAVCWCWAVLTTQPTNPPTLSWNKQLPESSPGWEPVADARQQQMQRQASQQEALLRQNSSAHIGLDQLAAESEPPPLSPQQPPQPQ